MSIWKHVDGEIADGLEKVFRKSLVELRHRVSGSYDCDTDSLR